MRLSARSEYGLLALIDLAGADDARPLATRELAEGRGIPSAFLEQLLADLRRAGLVRSTRGPRGGFGLARRPEEITALDIVEALEGSIVPSVCAPDACGREPGCAAASVWGDVSEAVRDALSSFTLARLAEEQDRLDRAPLTCTTRRSE
ncbi:MAG: RrF2 family transcriptional regulator [Coriobacteriia bacterium]